MNRIEERDIVIVVSFCLYDYEFKDRLEDRETLRNEIFDKINEAIPEAVIQEVTIIDEAKLKKAAK